MKSSKIYEGNLSDIGEQKKEEETLFFRSIERLCGFHDLMFRKDEAVCAFMVDFHDNTQMIRLTKMNFWRLT